MVLQPKIEILEKILVSIKQRSEYGEVSMLPLWDRLKRYSSNDLASLDNSYHTECYKVVTNKTKIERLKLRFQNRVTTSCSPISENESTTIQNVSVDDSITSRKSLRSNKVEYDKSLCIICQKEGGKLHTVEFPQTGPKMLCVASSSQINHFL